MRPFGIVFVVLLAACATGAEKKTDTAATEVITFDSRLGAFAGTWEGKVMPMTRDTTLTTVTTTAMGTKDGWSMTLLGGAPIALTLASIEGDSVVATAAGFPSALRKGATVKSFTGVFRVHGDMLMGTSHVSYDNGDTATFRTESIRKK